MKKSTISVYVHEQFNGYESDILNDAISEIANVQARSYMIYIRTKYKLSAQLVH